MLVRCRCAGPQAESAVDVDPGTVCMGDGDGRSKGVERAGVHVACLEADDGRAVSDVLCQRVDLNPPLVVRGDDDWCPEAEVAQCDIDRLVSLGTDQDSNPRRAAEAEYWQVPPCVGENAIARRGKAAEVRHGRAG